MAIPLFFLISLWHFWVRGGEMRQWRRAFSFYFLKTSANDAHALCISFLYLVLQLTLVWFRFSSYKNWIEHVFVQFNKVLTCYPILFREWKVRKLYCILELSHNCTKQDLDIVKTEARPRQDNRISICLLSVVDFTLESALVSQCLRIVWNE